MWTKVFCYCGCGRLAAIQYHQGQDCKIYLPDCFRARIVIEGYQRKVEENNDERDRLLRLVD